MTGQNYYEILGVSQEASQEDIKKSYKRLIRKYHPDRNTTAEAKDMATRLGEAYEVLKNPEKRSIYDRFGVEGLQDGFDPDAAAPSYGGSVDINDLFDEFGVNAQSREGYSKNAGTSGSKTNETPLHITLEEAFKGTSKVVAFDDRDVEFDIPRGIQNNTVLQPKSGSQGLKARIQIMEHELFQVDGANLKMDAAISIAQAALGDVINIPRPDGSKCKVKVPAGIQSGQSMQLPGKGMPFPDNGNRAGKLGDLFIRLQVETPVNLDEEQQTRFQELEEQMCETNMPGAYRFK